jgi:tRNA threonylcarbamoyladenosine biosynthesis protein TsaB
VGVTVGKMLSFASGKPVCGVPTLEALASAVKDRSRPVYAVIGVGAGDAVYAARYRVTDEEIKREGDYFTGDIDSLAALITEPCIITGKGISAYARQIACASGADVQSIEAMPGGAAVAVLAARRLARGESDDALGLMPLYLKESTAKVFMPGKYK